MQTHRNLSNLIKINTDEEAHISSISCSSMNVGSLKNKTSGVKNFIVDQNLDFLALTETWLFTDEERNSIYKAEMLPNNYNILHVPRANGQIGGGLAVVYKDEFAIKLIDSNLMGNNHFNQFEFLDCRLERTVSNKMKFLRIIVVYRPDPTKRNGLKLSLFWKQWTEFLSNLASSHTEYIITGDTNFHLDDKQKRNSKRFTKILDEFGLTQLVSKPTHTYGHTLDVLIVPADNCSIIPSSLNVHDPCISDNSGHLASNRHFAVMWSTICDRVKRQQRKEVKYQNFTKIDSSSFKADLENIHLAQKCQKDLSVDTMLTLILNELSDVVLQHAPVVKKTVSHQRPNRPWYNDHLKQLKTKRRQLERKYNKSGLEIDYQIYRNICNIYNSALYKAQVSYDQRKVIDAQRDKAKLFAITNSFMGKSNKKVLPSLFDDDKQTAESFLQFFHNKVKLITENLDQTLLEQSNAALPSTSKLNNMCKVRNVPKLLEYTPTTVSEVKDIVLNSNNKYCCLDLMPTVKVKDNIEVLAPALVTMYNKSFSSGEVPRGLKTAVLGPQIKEYNLDPEEYKNYRPISNLPFFCQST